MYAMSCSSRGSCGGRGEFITSLLCLALKTRPDIANAVIKLALFSSSLSVTHWTPI